MKIKPVYIDFESYWSVTHSLTRMTNIEYVMHPDTEIISMAMKVGNNAAPMVYFGEAEIRKALATVHWENSIAIGHNMSGFDSLILSWRFGINPKMWGCTLAMARSEFNASVGGSLGKLVAHFKDELEAMGISGAKDNTALVNTKGKHLKDFTREELRAMAVYNKNDTEQCAGLFKILAKRFPPKELLQVDLTTRMLVEPQFEVDTRLLRETLSKVQDEKAQSLQDLYTQLYTREERAVAKLEGEDRDPTEIVRSLLASSAQFGKFLESRGVEVPMKVSPTDPSKLTPALAKTDDAFLALQESDDQVVAAAARCRLEVKSTLLETRIGAFLAASSRTKGMRLPMPLRYAGAATTGRWSGEIFNPQNLPRITPGKPKLSDALRNSLLAPAGHKIVVSDLSGIELRVNMFLWQVPYAMELFRADPAKADLYKALASEVLNVPIEDMPKMVRQAGKAMHLGCGFGLGNPAKYQAVAKTMAQITVSEQDALDHIAGYRRKHPEIVKGWKTCHSALDAIASGIERPIDPWELCWTGKDHIKLPSGRKIWYQGLHKELNDEGRPEWWYGEGRNRARIYAGKVDENIVQALARDVMADVVHKIHRSYRYKPALLVHDEVVLVVPDAEAEIAQARLDDAMREATAWWPDLIKWSESDIATTYGAAK